MKNMILLQKTEDGELYCREISQKGIEYYLDLKDDDQDEAYWELGQRVWISEIEKILDKDV